MRTLPVTAVVARSRIDLRGRTLGRRSSITKRGGGGGELYGALGSCRESQFSGAVLKRAQYRLPTTQWLTYIWFGGRGEEGEGARARARVRLPRNRRLDSRSSRSFPLSRITILLPLLLVGAATLPEFYFARRDPALPSPDHSPRARAKERKSENGREVRPRRFPLPAPIGDSAATLSGDIRTISTIERFYCFGRFDRKANEHPRLRLGARNGHDHPPSRVLSFCPVSDPVISPGRYRHS